MHDSYVAVPAIETEIVEYCINELGLVFGDFWYEWFDSNKQGNHILLIKSKERIADGKVRETFPALSFVKEIIRVRPCPVYFDEDFKFEQYIQFRTK